MKIPLSYAHIFAADLVTVADVDQHEARIYQPGFTPDELRDSIRLMLRTTNEDEEVVAFQPQNIPPEHLDPHTHMVLHALLESRDRDKTATSRVPQARINNLNPDCPLDQEYAKLLQVHAKQDADYAEKGTEQNDTNRTMYRVFSDGVYTIHQNNFALYCKQIDWTKLGIKVFGAPLVFAPIDGPIHKRAAINEEGYFLGYQWPAMLVLRKSDEKVISLSRQKGSSL